MLGRSEGLKRKFFSKTAEEICCVSWGALRFWRFKFPAPNKSGLKLTRHVDTLCFRSYMTVFMEQFVMTSGTSMTLTWYVTCSGWEMQPLLRKVQLMDLEPIGCQYGWMTLCV